MEKYTKLHSYLRKVIEENVGKKILVIDNEKTDFPILPDQSIKTVTVISLDSIKEDAIIEFIKFYGPDIIFVRDINMVDKYIIENQRIKVTKMNDWVEPYKCKLYYSYISNSTRYSCEATSPKIKVTQRPVSLLDKYRRRPKY